MGRSTRLWFTTLLTAAMLAGQLPSSLLGASTVANGAPALDQSWPGGSAGSASLAAPATVVGSVFVVNTAADHDDGVCDLADCTLREAINAANAHAGPDTIIFRLPFFTCGGPVVQIYSDNNIQGVSGGGVPPTFSTNGTAYCVTHIWNYHWVAGAGIAPGQVSLTNAAGATIGSWQAVGTPGQAPNTSNANWDADVPVGSLLINGTYSCEDSDHPSWSQNAASNLQGFCTVSGQVATIFQPTIHLNSPLPAITDAVTIDGTGQDAGPVVIDGAGAGAGATGLSIRAAASTVRAISIRNFGVIGIYVGANGGTISGVEMRGNGTGLSFEADNLTVQDSTMSLNANLGVLGSGSNDTFSNNLVEANRNNGIFLGFPNKTTNSNLFDGNTVRNNGGYGYVLRGPVGDPTEITRLNTIRRGSNTGNTQGAIQLAFGANDAIARPVLTAVRLSSVDAVTTLTVAGTSAPGATIDIFTDPQGQGATYLASTTADVTGHWSNASWGDRDLLTLSAQLRSGARKITATQTSASDTSEFSLPSGETVVPNRKNHTWLTALPITTGAPQLDGLTRPYQSIWYRLPIQPQQRLRLDLFGLTRDYQLTVYRDLRKIARALGQVSQPSPPPIRAIGQLLAGNIAADTIDSDTIDSDTIDSDTIDSSTINADTIDSDTIDSDTIDSDTIDSDTIDSDTIDSDTIDSSGATDRGFGRVYETVQRRGLRAVSANPGTTPETLIFNTRGLTGDLYIRIRGHFGAFDPANLFTFVAAQTDDTSCVGADFTARHPLTAALALPTGRQTLILTNTAGFDAAGAFAADPTTLTLATGISNAATTLTVNETIPGWRHTGWITVGGEVMHYTAIDHLTRTFTVDARGDLATTAAGHLAGAAVTERALTKAEFLAQLDLLAASTDHGTVFDLAGDAGVLAAWTAWRGKPDCAALANVVSDAVRELIARFQTRSTLEYLVLVGSDHVIPLRRVPDRAEMKREGDFDPPLKGSSEASLIGNWFLTDDFYGASFPIARFDHDLYVSELATGRLVESVEDIVAYIRAYREITGVARPQRALASGYTFNSDLATYIADRLQSVNGYAPAAVDRLISDTWTAADMRDRLFGAPRYGLFALNGHYSANRLQPADSSSMISSREVADVADGRFKGAIVESIGCHSGYNIVDADRAGNTQPLAFPEAWVSRGATLVGGTGYQYGDTVVMKNTEELLAKLTQELGYANDLNGAAWADGVPIGKALRNAKLRYVNDLQSVRGLDEKIIGVSILYGVPNLRVVMPVRAARSVASIVLANPALDTRDDAQTFVVQGQPGAADFTLFPRTGPLGTYFMTGTSTTPDPFGVGTQPYRPITPRTVKDIEASNANVRGAVFMGGTYKDQAHVPQLSVPVTEDPGGAPTYATTAFQPVRPLRLNDIGGQTLVVTPFAYRSDALGASGTARLYTQVKTRIYYSNAATTASLSGAPEIRGIVLSRGGANTLRVEVTLAVQEASGVTDVFVSYTGSQQPLFGTWTTTSMGSPVATTRLRPADPALPAIATLRTYRLDITTGAADAATAQVMIQAVGGFGDVAVASNNGAFYQLVETSAPPANRPDTTLQLATPASATYRSKFSVTATLLSASGVALPAGRLVKLTFGGQKVTKATDAAGNVTATFTAAVAPSSERYPVTAAFLADDFGLDSSVSADVLVTRAASGFTLTPPASLEYSDSAIVASLRATIPGVTNPAQLVLGEAPVTLTIGTGPGARAIATQTASSGTVRFDTLDFDGVLPGTYTVTLHYDGSEKYAAATDASFSITVDRETSVVTTTALPPSPTGPITLRAQVTQTGPAGPDPTPGDLRNATVEWKLTPNVGAVLSASAPVDATGASTITVNLPAGLYAVEAQAGGAFRSAVAPSTLPVFDLTRSVAGAGRVLSPAGQSTTFAFATRYLLAPTIAAGTGGTLAPGEYRVAYSVGGPFGMETAIGASASVTVGAGGAIDVAAIRDIPFDARFVRFYILGAPAGQPTGFAVQRPVRGETMAAFQIRTRPAVASSPRTAPTGELVLHSRDLRGDGRRDDAADEHGRGERDLARADDQQGERQDRGARRGTFHVLGTPGGFDWLVITGTPPTHAVFEGTGTLVDAAGVSSTRHYRVTVDKPANTFAIQIDDPANPARPLVIAGTVTPLPIDDDPGKSGIMFR